MFGLTQRLALHRSQALHSLHQVIKLLLKGTGGTGMRNMRISPSAMNC